MNIDADEDESSCFCMKCLKMQILLTPRVIFLFPLRINQLSFHLGLFWFFTNNPSEDQLEKNEQNRASDQCFRSDTRPSLWLQMTSAAVVWGDVLTFCMVGGRGHVAAIFIRHCILLRLLLSRSDETLQAQLTSDLRAADSFAATLNRLAAGHDARRLVSAADVWRVEDGGSRAVCWGAGQTDHSLQVKRENTDEPLNSHEVFN